MSSSVGVIFPNMESHKSHVPNHQPEYIDSPSLLLRLFPVMAGLWHSFTHIIDISTYIYMHITTINPSNWSFCWHIPRCWTPAVHRTTHADAVSRPNFAQCFRMSCRSLRLKTSVGAISGEWVPEKTTQITITVGVFLGWLNDILTWPISQIPCKTKKNLSWWT